MRGHSVGDEALVGLARAFATAVIGFSAKL